ncbi:ubiquinone biosynthesis accessory factor UbiJ [Thalassotalea atypica]|uniref:ubiquinone biosynthesis accessory factor UbiJ n=1 Tax=Thalassotalea atypica TaxID=2054316 RepID=UPI002572A4CA|nr:SCP2 sterol-binding domain-containing protein [Thalassotalea atypica]
MHIQLLSSTIELILNQALKLSNQSASALTPLTNKSLAIELSELNAVLCLTVHEQQLVVSSPTLDDDGYDCKITTSVKTLVQLKTEQQLTQLIKDNQLDITGDIKVAQQFASIFETLNIDWPSELEKHIGDIATHKLLTLFKSVDKKVKFAQSQISSDASEYLVYEKKWLVTRLEIDNFAKDVKAINHKYQDIEQHFSAFSDKLEHIHQRIFKEG